MEHLSATSQSRISNVFVIDLLDTTFRVRLLASTDSL